MKLRLLRATTKMISSAIGKLNTACTVAFILVFCVISLTVLGALYFVCSEAAEALQRAIN